MKLYTTVKELKDRGACYNKQDWVQFMAKMELKSVDQKFSIETGLKIAGIKDCVWALRTQSGKTIASFLADVADLVLPIFMKRYPSDRRVQRCIVMIRKYKVGLCTKKDLRDAAYAAYDAADDAADDAAYAAYAAAYAAADDAAYAAYAAAARKETWKKITKLFMLHFGK